MTLFALLAAALTVAPTDGKTEAVDSWGSMSIKAVGRESPTGPAYLKVAAGDLNGDGVADEAVLKLTCDGSLLRSVYYNVTSPRDAASGQASGKRMHKPFTIVKEWGAATPQLMAVKPTYNVKKAEGSRASAVPADGWTPIELANADGLCAAAAKVTKTRSNIQNN